ncbi:hypothetical protein RJ641_033165 [Dillenia turbinata]|uniref:Uncharacterized protein n=1 Tax=Dillenia turbinata TaxID=194707 RepID=A0AAN8ZJ47_9MAGN
MFGGKPLHMAPAQRKEDSISTSCTSQAYGGPENVGYSYRKGWHPQILPSSSTLLMNVDEG